MCETPEKGDVPFFTRLFLVPGIGWDGWTGAAPVGQMVSLGVGLWDVCLAPGFTE